MDIGAEEQIIGSIAAGICSETLKGSFGLFNVIGVLLAAVTALRLGSSNVGEVDGWVSVETEGRRGNCDFFSFAEGSCG
jgi:hypothetical protein